MIGGYAHYYAKKKALKKQGMSEKEAHRAAMKSMDEIVSRTQQSPDPDQQSEFQRSNAFGRILAMFMSSANALARGEYAAAVEYARGRSSLGGFTKSIVIFHIIIPQLIQLASNMFKWDKEDQYRALAWGSINGVLVIGDCIEGTVNAITGGDAFPMETHHPLAVFTNLIQGAARANEISFEDVQDGLVALDKILKGTSGITGIPLSKLFNMLRGVSKTFEGEQEEGIPMMLGYSPYTIEKHK